MNTPIPVSRIQAHAMVGAHGTDPVLPDAERSARGRRTGSVRRVTAAGLHRLADAVAPAPQRSGRHA